MRSRLLRLSGIATAAALVLSPLTAAPANADSSDGTIIVKVVDTAGRATIGQVMLIPVSEPSLESAIPLGTDPGDGSSTIASSYQKLVPAGDYGVVTVTGWGGATCLGVSPCSLLAFSGAPGVAMPTVKRAVTVPASGTKSLTITTGLPVLRGTGEVGKALTVDFPAGFDELQTLMEQLLATMGGMYGGISFKPGVVWTRGGVAIPGATDTSYVPTAQDIGKGVSATTSYNVLFATFMSSMGGGFPVPSAFTTNAIAVKKVGTKVSVSVPAKVKQGKRPQVRVTAKAGAEEISGWAKVTVTGAGSHRVLVRRGYAAWKLPKLKAGKHKITVTFLATSTYSSSKATKKVTVKAAKPTKHKR